MQQKSIEKHDRTRDDINGIFLIVKKEGDYDTEGMCKSCCACRCADY